MARDSGPDVTNPTAPAVDPAAVSEPDRSGRRALRADAARNRERLVAAASESFAEHGPDAALEEIARRADVGIGTLYRHFPNREALMAAVVRDTFSALAARAAAGQGSVDPWASLEDWLRAYQAFAATKRGLIAGIVLLKEGDDEFTGLCDRLTGNVDGLLVRAQAAGVVRPGISAQDVLHLTSAIGQAGDRSGDPETSTRLFALALAGLRTPDAGGPPVS